MVRANMRMYFNSYFEYTNENSHRIEKIDFGIEIFFSGHHATQFD